MSHRIETVTVENFDRVIPLISRYQEFYQRTPDEAANRRYFSQFLGGNHPVGAQFVAISADRTSSCVLNDLFTVPEARKQGVAKALIAHCLKQARLRGYASLDWQTAPSNSVGRSLYDGLGAECVGWHHYSLPVKGDDR